MIVSFFFKVWFKFIVLKTDQCLKGIVNIPKCTNAVFGIIWKNKYASCKISNCHCFYGCYYWKQTFLFVLLYRQHCVISSDCIVSHHVILRYITHHNNVLRLVMSRYITKCHRLLCSQCTGLNFYGALHSIWRQALGSAQSNALKEITFYFVVCR